MSQIRLHGNAAYIYYYIYLGKAKYATWTLATFPKEKKEKIKKERKWTVERWQKKALDMYNKRV